ncbi:alpha/beta hydrolase [Guggenheimella bovis]
MKALRIILRILLILLVAVAFLLIALFGIHNYMLKEEEKQLKPLSKLVEVEGKRMSVYSEGEGQTLVFLAGGGTSAPILDFKSLTDLLKDEYRVVVVERFGYGFSDDSTRSRDLDTILSDTRSALKNAGIDGPYVLCPHSMSGLEALLWSQKYPEEVKAIVGLDMATPEAYDTYDIDLPALRVMQLGAKVGLTRVIPGISESDAMKHGTLTESEKNTYRLLFYKRTASEDMLREVENVKKNAEKVKGYKPTIPLLLFVSNGEGTGFDKKAWSKQYEDYIKTEDQRIVPLDVPHYIHDYKYEEISTETKSFLRGIGE